MVDGTKKLKSNLKLKTSIKVSNIVLPSLLPVIKKLETKKDHENSEIISKWQNTLYDLEIQMRHYERLKKIYNKAVKQK